MIAATKPLLSPDLVSLDARPATKEEAIRTAARLLVAGGYIDPAYADSMMRREAVADTCLGHGLAIPHGMVEDRAMIRHNGLAILQVPAGVTWNEGQTVRLVVAIAAQSDAHIAVLRKLTRVLQDEAVLGALFTTTDPFAIIAALDEEAAAALLEDVALPADLAERVAWTVDYPNGLHARPATRWVAAAKAAKADGARLQVRRDAATADPAQLIGLLQLGLKAGEAVTISAEGDKAAAALASFMAVVRGLTAEEKADADRAALSVAGRGWVPATDLATVVGLSAAPGLAIGPVHPIRAAAVEIADRPVPLGEASAAIDAAIAETAQDLARLADDTARRIGKAEAGIFAALAEILADPDLVTATCELVVAGHGPAHAWNEAVERTARALEASPVALLAARAADVRDVGRRVLGKLAPETAASGIDALPDTPSILVAADLSPSDTAGLDMARVAGLATAQGGPTSHTAILARTLGLPAMVAGGAALLDIPAGTMAILDGAAGRLYLDPTDADLAAARNWLEADARRAAIEAGERAKPATTTDGRTIEIAANVNKPEQVAAALDQGAEGVGLMRTEFLFLEAGRTPSEDEQAATYAAMAEALGGRPLIVRALDIGGDKQVAHLALPVEQNPFLGVRGARLLLRRPDLMEPQLRALYRAAASGARLSLMLPMITSVEEIVAVRAAAERIRAALDAPVIPIGIMVEVPSAAVMADLYAEHVDFFSIGTNDLTQYTLAIDRQHPDLAAEADSLHPAVLRLIKRTVEGAAAHGRWVGVCGGIAGDPFGACLLAGLGVDELSMTPRDIPGVKARLRAAAQADLAALAQKALACRSAADVRALDGARS